MTFTTAFIIRGAMFVLLFIILTVSVVSLFVRPAKRTIKATLVDDFDGGLIDISHAETSIGKAKTCDIVLTYMSVSRFHAVLSNSQNGWMIYDTHSSCGTLVNGKAIDKKADRRGRIHILRRRSSRFACEGGQSAEREGVKEPHSKRR